MARPVTTPQWADGGAADVVAPSAGKKALGFEDAEEPPAEYVNFELKEHADWLNYLDAGGHADKFKTCGVLNGGTLSGAGWARDITGRWIESSTDGSTWGFSVPFKEGDTLIGMRARVLDGGGTSSLTVGIQVVRDGVLIDGSAGGISSTAGALQTIADDLTAPLKLLEDDVVNVIVAADGGGSAQRQLYSVRIQFENNND